MLNNSVFWNITNTVLLLIEIIMFFLILDEFGTRKKDLKLIVVYILSMLIIVSIIKICPHIEYNAILFWILCIVFCKINYSVTWANNIIISSIFIMIGTVSDLLGISIVKTFNHLDNISAILEYNEYRLEGIIISKLLLVTGIAFIKYYKMHDSMNKRDFVFIGLPIIVNILSILQIFKYEMILNDASDISRNQAVIMSLFLCLSSVSLVFVVLEIANNNKLKTVTNSL